jgi:LmbE family N-acetylglucosaminyl deacetylase
LAAGPILTAAPLPGLQSTEIKAGLKVVCVGGHPDDPESGCAGTLALYQELGNIPTIVYLTRGERGIQGKSNDEAAQIRSAECESACKVLGEKARFAGQIDGSADFTRTRVDEILKILAEGASRRSLHALASGYSHGSPSGQYVYDSGLSGLETPTGIVFL